MSRPLISKSMSELAAAVVRNRTNRAELDLILSELRFRTSAKARDVEAQAKGYIAAIDHDRAAANAKILMPNLHISKPRSNAAKARWGTISLSPASPPEDVSARRAAPSSSASEVKAMEQERRWTEDAVAKLRTKLIDLSKRSPLIAFKHGGRSASILRIVDERPDLLFEALEDGPMRFEPLPEEDVIPRDEQTHTFTIAYERERLINETFLAATEKLGDDEADARAWQVAERALRAEVRRQLGLPALDYGKALDVRALAIAHGFDPSFDLKASDDDDVADHHEDDKIRVLLTRNELEKRLKAIWDRYRSHARETGLHTLFLALGFVQWYEDDSSDTALHAPLLLLSVELDRQIIKGRYEYTLTSHDEGLQVNMALAEKMRQHFGLELPALREEEEPESYFIRVEAVLKQGRKLSLRRFATLAVLPFPRMVLWKDLDPEAWSEGAFARHKLLPILLGARPMGESRGLGEAHDIDAPAWADRAPTLIQPADASQHSALIDVSEGHSLAIEGPPGTGKSQTITNIIANALDAGERVLFVAEKQAALAVVANRLREAGFGPLLLGLHGDNANRLDFYDGLRERLSANVRGNEDALYQARQTLRQKRGILRKYLSLLRSPLGSLGRTAYWLAWREINLRAGLDRAAVDATVRYWRPSDVRTIDRTTLRNRRDRLDNFAKALAALEGDAERDGRTLWTKAERLGAFDQRPQLEAARNAAKAAADLHEITETYLKLGLTSMPLADGALDEAADQLDELEGFDHVEEDVARSALTNPSSARALLARQARWRQLGDRLSDDVNEPAAVSDDQLSALEQALAQVDAIPETVKDLEDRISDLAMLLTNHRLGRDDKLVINELVQVSDVTVTDLQPIIGALAQLETMSPAMKAMIRAELLDPLVEVALANERQLASDLDVEATELSKSITPEAEAADVASLLEIATTLSEGKLLARIFSPGFRRAKNQARRWLCSFSDRLDAAETLRRLVRLKNNVDTFRTSSPAAAWFPPALWRGVQSDWEAMCETVACLKDAQFRLSSSIGGRTFGRWMSMTAFDRSRVGSAADRLHSVMDHSCQAGFGRHSFEACEDGIQSFHDKLVSLRKALAAIATKEEAAIVRDKEHLADRLKGFRSAKAEFDNIARDPSLSWVGDISIALDSLARALTQADALSANDQPLAVLDTLRASSAPVALLESLIANRRAYCDAVDCWQEATTQFEAATGTPISMFRTDQNWDGFAALLKGAADDEVGARLAADLWRYRQDLADVSLDGLARAALDGAASADTLADLYELFIVRTLLDDYIGSDGAELSRLGGLSLEAARKAFVQIDEELHKLEAHAIVSRRLGDEIPRGTGHGPKRNWTEMALIESELGLKNPRMSRTPVRDVIHRSGNALRALKPVWMMSPTSAAQYIRPDSFDFDLLVIDEASQMRPEFAVSVVLRGKQIVVVGDANQLPPTDFFSTAGDDGDVDGDEGPSIDNESILDLATSRLRHKRRLRWHYRSQHESLIQFSNRQFYDRDLVVFPSPTTDDELLGVKSFYVGGTYEASINQAEAEAVIEEAFRLMRAFPQRSLGIATMNSKQAELIRNEFDRLILEAPEVRSYIDAYAGGIEEFFIKNLENVQGDERDIILISTVYGPDKNGTVAQRFGPINREVGWRRLNVLVTRAKISTRIFTSLRPEDIKVTETSSRGLVAFKSYLTYASKSAEFDDDSGGEADSDFEIYVAEALRDAGYEIVHQVGVEGFRIDLGVKHPDYPLGFIAGIECDGASFHSGMTVRDRDRIRQTVLERMGWRIYRIWSTDWFADAARQTARLLAQLEAWRELSAAEYARRPKGEQDTSRPPSASKSASVAATPARPALTAPASLSAVPAPPAPPAVAPTLPRSIRVAPTGRPMRPLDGISWFETVKDSLYEVWNADKFAGEVEVLSRAMSGPKVYGDKVMVARNEYEGWVAPTNSSFKAHDIYAAVREVSRKASLAAE